MEKTKIKLSINNDIIEHSKNNSIINSLSEWICEKYYEEFMIIDSLNKKIQQYNNATDYCIEQITKIRKESKKNKLFSDKEIEWIINIGIPAIRKTTLNGVYKRFIYNFNSIITKRQFMLTLSELGYKGDMK